MSERIDVATDKLPDEMPDLPIGTVIQLPGMDGFVKVVEHDSCRTCSFWSANCGTSMYCDSSSRKDHKKIQYQPVCVVVVADVVAMVREVRPSGVDCNTGDQRIRVYKYGERQACNELLAKLEQLNEPETNRNRRTVMNLPARMTEVVDDIGSGAFLKRMSDGAKAIVIDYVEIKGSGRWIVAMVKERFRDDADNDCTLSKPKDYVIRELANTDEWIVLHAGYDYDLVE